MKMIAETIAERGLPRPMMFSTCRGPFDPDRWDPGLQGAERLRFITNCFTRLRCLDGEGKLRPLAEVVETTRALKLVTLTINSLVRTKVRDERWRGWG